MPKNTKPFKTSLRSAGVVKPKAKPMVSPPIITSKPKGVNVITAKAVGPKHGPRGKYKT